jgi:alpha-mannosidase
MAWNAQIISHTHWDREWYLNSKYTNEWLVPFFDQLLAMFEKEEDYQFVLDGQMAMIDDYFEELDKLGRPVFIYRNKIKKYVSEGRLFVGPYYLQPDWQLLSEESLVRNMMIGNKKASEYGSPMKVGWLLDNFGQMSQTAQIHKKAGLDGLYVWRGVEMDPTNVKSEFVWEAPDGSRLPSVYLLNSYRNVMRLAEYSEIMQKRIFDEVDKLEDFMTSTNVLMMNGYDQEMVPDDIQPKIKNGGIDTDRIKVTQSNPERYLKSVLDEDPDLITLKGALYSGRFISVFPGVMSARMYLKLQNDISEKAITKYAEPLAMLDWLHGSDYDSTTFDKAWELLLKNHPHDSICGVSIDDVHSDMEERTRDFRFLIDYQIRKNMMNLAKRIDTSELSDTNYFVFNPSPFARSASVTVEGKDYYVNDVQPFGYTLITKNEVENPVVQDKNVLKNGKVEVTIHDNGTFDVYHIETKERYKGLGQLEDAGDAGDEYNYSYPDTDRLYYSTDEDVNIEYKSVTEEKAIVEMTYTMKIPVGITKNRKERSTELKEMPVRTVITLEANSDIVKVKTDIRNTVKDHIVRALFPTNIEATHAYAGSAFDVVERPIHIDDYDESMIPENVRKVIVGARESKPNTIFNGREMVDLNDGTKGMAVLSKGLPEYTVYKKGSVIALTLFRSVAWVAYDINTRIGDAGPEIFTPEAQCLREMSFEYAVYPHSKHYDEGKVIRAADDYNNDLKIFVTDKHQGDLAAKQSFIKVEDDTCSLRITSIKRSNDGKGVILRVYNGTAKDVVGCVKTFRPIKNLKKVNLLEQEVEKLNANSNEFNIEVEAKAIETYYFEMELKTVATTAGYADIVEESEPYDFSAYEYLPLVLPEEIEVEVNRAEKLKAGLNDPMLRRTALEAQLSAILAQDRYHEKEVHGLGYQLNEARVERRVYDYIKDTLK